MPSDQSAWKGGLSGQKPTGCFRSPPCLCAVSGWSEPLAAKWKPRCLRFSPDAVCFQAHQPSENSPGPTRSSQLTDLDWKSVTSHQTSKKHPERQCGEPGFHRSRNLWPFQICLFFQRQELLQSLPQISSVNLYLSLLPSHFVSVSSYFPLWLSFVPRISCS